MSTVVNMKPGQQVTLTAQPTVAGQNGGSLPATPSWSNNANLINIQCTLTPSSDGMNCVVAVPSQLINGTASFSVFCTSGTLSATAIIALTGTTADGLTVIAGTPQ